jgi:integrase
MMPSLRQQQETTHPTEWHRFFGFGADCAICGCSAAALVDYKPDRRPSQSQLHRATDGSSATTSRWERKYKTTGGKWTTKPVAKHRLGHRQRGEVPRITEGVKTALATAAALLAVGNTKSQVCRIIKVRPATFWNWKARHRDLWRGLEVMAACMKNAIAKRQHNLADPHQPTDRPILPADWKSKDGPLAGTLGVGQSLPDFYQKTYRSMRLIGCSPQTGVQYEVAIRHLCRYAGRVVTLGDLSDELITGCMTWMLHHGTAAPTVNKFRRSILAIWRFAFRRKTPDGQRLVKELPSVERLREMKRIPDAWSIEEFSRLLKIADASPGLIDGIPAGQWWRALLLVLYYSGIRVAAGLLIRVQDLEWTDSGAILFVPAEHQKQKADQRFNLPKDVADALNAIIGNRTGQVFRWQRGMMTLNNRFRQMIEAAEIQPGRGACPLFHKVRRTSATQVAAKLGRAAACDHLGHSAMSVTERYLDPTKIPRIRAADVLPTPDGVQAAG